MDLDKVFNDFCAQLRTRTEFTSEDTIRYYWFASMLNQDSNLNNYSLEEPYAKTSLPNKELDLLYDNKLEEIVLEIKFHRNTTKSTFAHTDAAGAIFGDIMRLPCAPISCQNSRRIFLYVTDKEMNQYLRNTSNPYRTMLNDFYMMPKHSIVSFSPFSVASLPQTFWRSTIASFVVKPTIFAPPKIKLLESWDYVFPGKHLWFKGNECHVRLYEIIN